MVPTLKIDLSDFDFIPQVMSRFLNLPIEVKRKEKEE